MEAVRRQLVTVQLQKESAQGQLWQLAELQEQLQASEAERRRLAAALRQAQPVSLALAVGEAAAEAAEAQPADVVVLRVELAEAEQHSEQLRGQLAAMQTAAGVEQPTPQAADAGEGIGGSSDEDMATRLQAAEAEAERLRAQLAELQPIRLRLRLREDAAHMATPGSDLVGALVGPAPGRGGAGRRSSLDQLSPMLSPGDGGAMLTREASDSSLGFSFSAEQATALSKERAAADAAWREHQKVRAVVAGSDGLACDGYWAGGGPAISS